MLRILLMSTVAITAMLSFTLVAAPPSGGSSVKQSDEAAPTTPLDPAAAHHKGESTLDTVSQQFYRKMDAYTPPMVNSLTVSSQAGVSIEFVHIHPGRYTIGRNIGKAEAVLRIAGHVGQGLDEGPEHDVTLDRGYFMARRQVTSAQFAIFLNHASPEIATQSVVLNSRSNVQREESGRYTPKPGADRFPANTVTWKGASEFTKWLSQTSGWSMRLPTESEWEAAARTQQGFLGPTGGPKPPKDPETGLIPGIRPGEPGAAVDAFPENMTVNGLFHTVSIVGDWTSDAYAFNRAKGRQSTDLDSVIAKTKGGHVMKGRGSLTSRAFADEIGENGVFGFRVLLEADEGGAPIRTTSSKSKTN